MTINLTPSILNELENIKKYHYRGLGEYVHVVTNEYITTEEYDNKRLDLLYEIEKLIEAQ